MQIIEFSSDVNGYFLFSRADPIIFDYNQRDAALFKSLSLLLIRFRNNYFINSFALLIR